MVAGCLVTLTFFLHEKTLFLSNINQFSVNTLAATLDDSANNQRQQKNSK